MKQQAKAKLPPKKPLHGWINLNKPQGMTSTQALGAVKRILRPLKAGHGGTLDPLATGVLPIALGEATKTVNNCQDNQKGYRFTIKWGQATDTDDSEGEIIATSDVIPSIDDIQSALPAFIGEVEQVPPKYSAIKINGERAYDLARDGQEVEIPTRIVDIDTLELMETTADTAMLSVTCGKGTYVRAIARDLALKLGTYGHIIQLERTFVGSFSLQNAISLDILEKDVHKGDLNEAILPLETVLDDILALPLTERDAQTIRHGQQVVFSSRHDVEMLETKGVDPATAHDQQVLMVAPSGKPLGLGRLNGVRLQTERLFNL